jgi:hypothetical protein
LGFFYETNLTYLNTGYMGMARILVGLKLLVGLANNITIQHNGSYYHQALDYGFKCRQWHIYGHLAKIALNRRSVDIGSRRSLLRRKKKDQSVSSEKSQTPHGSPHPSKNPYENEATGSEGFGCSVEAPTDKLSGKLPLSCPVIPFCSKECISYGSKDGPAIENAFKGFFPRDLGSSHNRERPNSEDRTYPIYINAYKK